MAKIGRYWAVKVQHLQLLTAQSSYCLCPTGYPYSRIGHRFTERLPDFRIHLYPPNKKVGAKGVIFNYRFAISTDGKNWETVSEGEFSNIKNNPIPQTKY